MKQTKGFIVIPVILMGAAALMAISSLYLWHQVADLNLGATNFVGGERYRLAGSGVAAADTSITLSSFTYGPNSVELLMADFGSIGYATIEPGTANKEFISFTTVTQNANNSQATLGSVTRGLNFVAPYTASTTLRLAHSGGSTVIISNPPQLYSRAVFQDNTSTISGVWTFSATSGRPLYNQHPTWADVASTTFADKDYVDGVATSGAADATLLVKGLVELASQAEMQAGTATGGTSANLALWADYANSTSSATTTIPITKTTGKLDQGFLDLTESYTWTGAHTHSATSTFASTTNITGTFNASSTANFSATTTFNGTVLRSSDDTKIIWPEDGMCNTGTSTAVLVGAGTSASSSQSVINCHIDGAIRTWRGSVNVPFGNTAIESIKVFYFASSVGSLYLQFATKNYDTDLADGATSTPTVDDTDNFTNYASSTTGGFLSVLSAPAGSYNGLGALDANDTVQVIIRRKSDVDPFDGYNIDWHIAYVEVKFDP